jgi:hypothetical protein
VAVSAAATVLDVTGLVVAVMLVVVVEVVVDVSGGCGRGPTTTGGCGRGPTTTAGVAMTGGPIILGADLITDSPLQSAASIAMFVCSLILSAAPTIMVERSSAALRSETRIENVVVTEYKTVSESCRTAAESRRAPTVKPVIVISETGTNRATDKPVFLASV